MSDIEFISLGGWCGTKIALQKNKYFRESYPFDYVRSSLLGVIDCFENDFQNYFPKENYKQPNGLYLSRCCEFHHEDITSQPVIMSFHRKINRFRDILKKSNKKICFLRTVCLNDYDNELKYYKELQNAIEKSYPNLKYILCFIITKQHYLSYYKHLDNKTFIFLIDNVIVHENHDYMEHSYKYILDFIIENNLFSNIPSSNDLYMVKRNIFLQIFGLLHT
jgi:hypothetical protein